MTTGSPQHRRGMVFVDDNGEYDALRQIADSIQVDSEDSDYDTPDSVSDSSSYRSNSSDDLAEIADYWDPYLYQLQQKAPKPNCIPCRKQLPDAPAFYGQEYHGMITREQTGRLLGSKDGNYLVRSGLSHAGSYSLSFVFGGQVRHYRLYHDGRDHYVGEKPFETIEDLVQDGLITLYMEANNVEDYLQSARETVRRPLPHPNQVTTTAPTQTTGQLDQIPELSDEAVFTDESNEGLSPPPVPSHGSKAKSITYARRPPYHPCTIPLKRDSIREQSEQRGGVKSRRSYVGRVYEEVKEDHIMTALANGEDRLPKPSVEDEKSSKCRKDSSLYFHYDKPHNFKLHTYGMAWCDFCRNFMWGLRNQGYRCKDCGYNAHKQCKDETAPDCQPSRQLVKRVYGVELTTLVKMHGTKVPVVVKDSIEELERRGITTEGLYRVSGKTNDVLRIKKQFDNDMCSDLTSIEDVHAITGALKLYLRELPIPLMTFDSYDLCLIAARTNSVSESLDMLKVALQRLPPAHYNTLRHLVRHLYKVQRQKDFNKMDAKNLAVIFTPTVMRSPYNHTGIMAVQKLPEQKKAMDLLIQHYHTLFQ